MSEIHTLHIKNMVCPRCVMVVESLLRREGLTPVEVVLGMASVEEEIDAPRREHLRRELEACGFELLDDKRLQLADEIRTAVIERVHYSDGEPEVNLSDYLRERFHRDYSALSKLFSEVNGLSIEKYYLYQKIERAKELLTYGQMTVGEIADLLHYSSVAHFSTQFRNITGMSPTVFRRLGHRPLRGLDQV